MSGHRGKADLTVDASKVCNWTFNGHWAENLIKSIESSSDRATSNVMA
jgi:hypothetical protein